MASFSKVGSLSLMLWLAPLLIAQSTASKPLPDAPSAQKESSTATSEGYVLGVIPQFNVTDAKNTKPLTPGGKFHLFVRQTFDPFQFIGVGFVAGIGQARDSFPDYGQGALGYAKRYGAALADNVNGAFWGNYVLPVALKEDPRYFRLGEGGTWHRVGYSLSRTVVTRTDSGNSRFNFSNIFGNIIAGGFSNLYYPQSDRGVGLTFQRAAVVTALGAVGGIGQEFLPDIDRMIFRHKKKQPPTPGSTPANPTDPK